MVLGHAQNLSPHRPVEFVQKREFKTSFHVKIESLIIPAGSATEFDRSKPTIFFFNGWMMRLSQWGYQMPRFTGPKGIVGFEDYNLVFLNNLGHGQSEMNGTKPEEYILFCARAAHELATELNVGDVITVSHSMGALTALEFEHLLRKKVKGMAFISPVFSNPLHVFPYGDFVEPRLGTIKALLETGVISTPLIVALKLLAASPPMRFWHKVFTATTGSAIRFDTFKSNLQKALDLDVNVFVKAFQSMVQRGDELGSRLGEVDAPKLVLLGGNDFITDHAKTRALIETLDASAQTMVLPKTTHWGNSERPRSVNQHLADFFGTIDGNVH